MRKITPKQDEYMMSEGPSISMKKKKAEPIYPKIRIDLEHIPEAKKWDIGKEYKVELKLKMVGLSISRYDNTAEFEIRELGCEGMKEDKNKAEENGEKE